MTRAERVRVLSALTAAVDAITDVDDPRLADVFDQANAALETYLLVWSQLLTDR